MTYFRQTAQAKRLIAAKGELCQWLSVAAPIAADPAKPWVKSDAGPVANAVSILFTSSGGNSLFKLLAGSSVPAGKKQGLMATVGFTPGPKDSVVRSDGTKLGIESVDSLAPNGEVILWWITFKQ